MYIHDLKNAEGARTSKKRLGRGIGSGIGNDIIHITLRHLAYFTLIGKLACFGNYYGFTLIFNIKVEEMVGCSFFADALAVYKQLNLGLI